MALVKVDDGFISDDGFRFKIQRNDTGFWEYLTDSYPILYSKDIQLDEDDGLILEFVLHGSAGNWFILDDVKLAADSNTDDTYELFVRDIVETVSGNPQVYGEIIEFPNPRSVILVPTNEYMTHSTFNTILGKMEENYQFLIDKAKYINVPPNAISFRYGKAVVPNTGEPTSGAVWRQLDYGHYLDWKYTEEINFKNIVASDDFIVYDHGNILTLIDIGAGLDPNSTPGAVNDRTYYIYGDDTFNDIVGLSLDSSDRIWVLDKRNNNLGKVGIFSYDGNWKFETIWDSHNTDEYTYLEAPTDIKISNSKVYISCKGPDNTSIIKEYTESGSYRGMYVLQDVEILSIAITDDFVIALGEIADVDRNRHTDLYIFNTEYELIDHVNIFDKIFSYQYTDSKYPLHNVDRLFNNNNGIFFYAVAGNLIYKFNQLGDIVESFGETAINFINVTEPDINGPDRTKNISAIYHDRHFNLYVSSDYDIIKYLDRAELGNRLTDNEIFNIEDDNWLVDDITVDKDENTTAWVYNRIFNRIYDQLTIFRLALKGSLTLMSSSSFESVVIDNFTRSNYKKFPYEKTDINVGINELHCEGAINRSIMQLNECFEVCLDLLNIRNNSINPDVLSLDTFTLFTQTQAVPWVSNRDDTYFYETGRDVKDIVFKWTDNIYYRNDTKLNGYIIDPDGFRHNLPNPNTPLTWTTPNNKIYNENSYPPGSDKLTWTLYENYGEIVKHKSIDVKWSSSIYYGTIPDGLDLADDVQRSMFSSYPAMQGTIIDNDTKLNMNIDVSNDCRFFIAVPQNEYDDDADNGIDIVILEPDYPTIVGSYEFTGDNKRSVTFEDDSQYYILTNNDILHGEVRYPIGVDVVKFTLHRGNQVGDTAKPPAPSNLRVADASDSTIQLAWDSVKYNETGWNVYRSEDPFDSWYPIASNLLISPYLYSDNTVGPNTTYRYKMTGVNDYGTSDYSNIVEGTSVPLHISTPTNLDASQQSFTSIVVTWTDTSVNEERFKLQRKTTGAYNTILDMPTGNQLGTGGAIRFEDKNLTEDTTYTYRVRAEFNSESYSDWSTIAIETTDGPNINRPTDLSAVFSNLTAIDISWTDNSNDEERFIIKRKENNEDYEVIANDIQPDVTTYTDTDFDVGASYTYTVSTYNAAFSPDTRESNPVVVSTVLAEVSRPSDLTVRRIAGGKVTLDWNNNGINDAITTVERKYTTESDATYTVLATTGINTNNIDDDSFQFFNKYTYRVKNTVGLAVSAYSTPFSIHSAREVEVDSLTAKTTRLFIKQSSVAAELNIDWGDGTPVETISHAAEAPDTTISHTYPASHTRYTQKIEGVVPECQYHPTIRKVLNLGHVLSTTMKNMFLNCKLLESVNSGSCGMQNVYITESMFEESGTETFHAKGCSYDLSTMDVDNVWNTTQMFAKSYIKSLTVNTWDTNHIRTAPRMFNEAKVHSAFGDDISSWTMNSLEDASSMFEDLNGGRDLDLVRWSCSNLKHIKCMFKYARYIRTLNVSNFNTHNVTDFTEVFANMLSMSAFNINWDTEKGTNATGMFRGASQATTINIHFEFPNLENASYMFYGLASLQAMDISRWYLGSSGSLTNCSRMFGSMRELKSLLGIGSLNTSNVSNMDYMFSLTGLTTFAFDNWDCNNLVTCEAMFYMSTALTTVTGLSNWRDNIKMRNVQKMFYMCSNLTSVDSDGFLDWDTVLDAIYCALMFYKCSRFSDKIDPDEWFTSGAEYYLGTFHKCLLIENMSGDILYPNIPDGWKGEDPYDMYSSSYSSSYGSSYTYPEGYGSY